MGKVVENGKVEFEEIDDAGYTDFEIIRHVRDALSSVMKGDSENYNELLGHLHHKKRLSPDEVAFLVTSLKALSGAVSYIDVHHHVDLLNAIFGMRMWDYATDVMDALVELIISLAASNAKCIVECLEMLVKNFVPPYYILNAMSEPFGQARKEQVLSRVHAALKDISNLVPLAPMLLSPIVIRHMPNVYSKEPVIRIYVENMLNLESGAIREVVGGKMLLALIDRMIELDVEIGWDDILHDDSSKGIFEMELKDVDDLEDDDDNKDDFQLTREFLRHSLQGNVVAEKLDSLMVQTFEHLEHCQNNDRLEEVFNVLLDSFERTVLNAYKSKFTQFVMFYACALDPEDCGLKFAQKLLEMFESNNNPPLTRMSAVAYLASYLSRGNFLSASLVVNVLTRLVDWCDGYCRRHNDEANPIAHKVFYSACQAIMYVLCFRMRSWMSIPWRKIQHHEQIESILKHKLSPLKVCLPSVVKEFLKQARAASLVSTSESFNNDDNVLESDFSKSFGGMNRLDMFFPFDPCLLKKSNSFISPNFIYWSAVGNTYSDDEHDGSSYEDPADNDAERTGEDMMAVSYDDIDDFDSMLNKMSITPKNSLAHKFGAMRMPSRIRPSTSLESL